MKQLVFMWRSNYRELIALGAVLFIYILGLALSPKNVFWSPDEGSRFIMANILSSGSEQEDRSVYPGISNDPDFRFHPGYYKYKGFMYPIPNNDGTYKFPWGIAFPYLSGQLFRYLGIYGLFMIPLISGWLITLLAWKIVKKQDPSLAIWTILLVGLGTPIYFYTQVYWDHTLATLLGIFSLYILATNPNSSFKTKSLVILPLILAISLRVEMLAFALALGFAWLITQRRISTTKRFSFDPKGKLRNIIILLVILLLIIFIFLALPARYSGEFIRLGKDFLSDENLYVSAVGFLERNINELPHVLINYTASEGLWLPEGLGWLGIFALVICIFAVLVRSRRVEFALIIPSLLLMCGLTLYAVLTTQHYRSLHGFIICIPYSLIAIFGLNEAWKRREYSELLVYLSALLYFFLGVTSILVFRAGKATRSWPGLEWGQRYLLTLYPILALLSLLAIKRYWDSQRPQIFKLVVIALTVFMMAISFSIQLRGVWMLRQSRQTIAVWSNYLQMQSKDPVVTDAWWLPASLAPFFTTHEMYLVLNADDFSEWLLEVGADNVTEFTYVSSSPLDLSSLSTPSIQVQRNEKRNIADLRFIHYSIHITPQTD